MGEEHTCIPVRYTRKSFGQKELIHLFTEKIRDNLFYSAAQMIKDLKRDYKINIKYSVYYTTKQSILTLLNKETILNFSFLQKFLFLLREKNPGTFIQIQETEGVFQRAFFATSLSINSLKYLRPLISLDRIYMRSEFKGILLCAVGIDALGSIVPLCYAWVLIEDKNNWAWFLTCFKKALRHSLPIKSKLTILSDRQKGILNAVSKYFPNAAHGLCVKHLLKNLKRQINNQTVNLLI